MRLITVGLGIAALLVTSVASAAGPSAGSGAGQKGDTGGKAGTGPENSTQSGAQGQAEQGGEVDTSLTQFGNQQKPGEKGPEKVQQEKPWEIFAGFETHHLLEQGYLVTTGQSQVTFMGYTLGGRYDLTDNDIVSIGGGAVQYLQADPGEPGWRLFDINLAYTHRFQLPAKFNLATSASLSLPISYQSQLASNITTPSISATLSRKFGDLTVALNVRGLYFWDKYTSENSLGAGQDGSAAGEGAGAPNTQWAIGGGITAEYQMPFHRAWSVGALVSDSYYRPYNVGSCPLESQCYGATTYPTIDNQPVQQSYGWEIFTRYILPDLEGFKSDVMVAFADGDPSLGYPSLIHDGVVHPYLLYYDEAEVYLALEGRY
jgi:hypothetical protein